MADRREDSDRREGRNGPERRMGDRRDSHRVALDVEVKVGNQDYRPHRGNVAIGGVYFDEPLRLPTGAEVQLRFDLPGLDKRIETMAEVVEITSMGKPGEVGTRVKFVDLKLRSELLLARFLDQQTGD